MPQRVHRPSTPPEPQVGIYWWYRRKLLAFTEPVAAVPPVESVHDSAFGHDALWPQVQRQHPELREREYYEVPRGRVLYVANHDEYWLFAPVALHARPAIIARIIRRFGLPVGKVHLKTDLHYEPPPEDADDA